MGKTALYYVRTPCLAFRAKRSSWYNPPSSLRRADVLVFRGVASVTFWEENPKDKMGAHEGEAKKLNEELVGKSSAECREIVKVSEPWAKRREIREGTLLETFETKGKLGDDRYLPLFLDGSGKCTRVDLIDQGKTTRDDA